MAESRASSRKRQTVRRKAPEPAKCPYGFCPLCNAVDSVQGTAPDVLEHLLGAAREFLLAAKAVIDAGSADGSSGGRSKIEKIDIA